MLPRPPDPDGTLCEVAAVVWMTVPPNRFVGKNGRGG